MTGLQAIPPIAWLPIAILWFGFTERAVIFVVVIGAIAGDRDRDGGGAPPGAADADPRGPDDGGAKGWPLYRSVVLPASVPGYWLGLQQAWAVAWRALPRSRAHPDRRREGPRPRARPLARGHRGARPGVDLRDDGRDRGHRARDRRAVQRGRPRIRRRRGLLVPA